MADKPLLNDAVGINFSLESADETAAKMDEPLPPPYQYPQIDFSSGWKDLGFAIAFWIHMVAVIIVGLVLGIPILLPYVKHNILNRQEPTSFDSNIRLFVYSSGGAAATGGFISFVTFFLLQQCAGRIIICSLIIIVTIEILLVVLLSMVSWSACIGPGIILLFTLIYIWCIRKRIAFAETHLRVGCAVLRSRPSLILVALVIFVVEILWLAFWCLMVLGILHVSNHSILNRNINTTTTNVNSTTAFNVSDAKPTLINKTPYMINNKTYQINEGVNKYNTTANSSSDARNLHRSVVACTVGQWWFITDTGQQYAIRTSVKRAFTTNFGTICFGSLFEAIVKALRSCTENKNRRRLVAWCALCILQLLEKLIGYINEWAFIYAALTGQSFLETGRSFIELFRKRGWTMVINDSLVENCLMIVNIVVGLTSAAIGGLMAYVLIWDSPKKTVSIIIIIIAIISFLIAILMSTIMTTILTSCVRTVFVCFALNPAALGATHPDHLQSLTKVWHEFYPNEFATSGYNNYFPKPTSEDNV